MQLLNYCIFNTQPLWILIKGWEQIQESHYIQPSNLSSALGPLDKVGIVIISFMNKRD